MTRPAFRMVTGLLAALFGQGADALNAVGSTVIDGDASWQAMASATSPGCCLAVNRASPGPARAVLMGSRAWTNR